MEVVAWRQARPLLLDQRDARAASRLVPGGPGAALRAFGNSRHPAAVRGGSFFRGGRGGPPPSRGGGARGQALPLPGPPVAPRPGAASARAGPPFAHVPPAVNLARPERQTTALIPFDADC